MHFQLAQTARDISELFSDPALTVACVLLIVASVAWIVVSRLIVRQIKRAALRARAAPLDVVRPPKDIWSYPPPEPVGSVSDGELVVVVDDIYVYDFSGGADGGGGADEGGGADATYVRDTSVIRLDEPQRAL